MTRDSRRALALLVVGLAVLVIAPPPSPVHLSYVTSDSMEPALSQGDAYPVVDGTEIQEGDVILFATEERYVAHRVVDETATGYVTQGDANPSTDQAGGEPPVPDDRVLGVVPTVGDTPIAVPWIGNVVSVIGSSPAAAIVALLGAALLARWPRGPSTSGRAVRIRDVALLVLLVSIVACLVVLSLAGSTHAVTYQVVDEEATDEHELAIGEPAVRDVHLTLSGTPFTTAVAEGDGLTVVDQSVDGSSVAVTAQVPPPERMGSYEATIELQPYPATLPTDWLRALHAIHPSLAMLVSSAVPFLPALGLYALLFDGRTPIRRPTRGGLYRGGP